MTKHNMLFIYCKKGDNNEKNLDKICFEYRDEVQEMRRIISRYLEQNPEEKNNETLTRFSKLLDQMDMEW